MLNFALCLIVFSIGILNENLLAFSLKTYNGDVYTNTIILIFSGCFASYFTFALISRF